MQFKIHRNPIVILVVGHMLFLCVWCTLFVQSLQFPPGFHGKRFNIEAVPTENVSYSVCNHSVLLYKMDEAIFMRKQLLNSL
jgi:hypothetical protein